MRKTIAFALLAGALGLCFADMADAQGMGQGMGQGSGGGRGSGGHRRGNRGGGQGGPNRGPLSANMPAPASVPAYMRLNGVVTIAGQSKSLGQATMTAAKADQSILFAERQAQLKLTGVQMMSTSTLSMLEDGRQTGLASALLVTSQSHVTMDGGAISTDGNGVNAIFTADQGSQIALKNVSISTHAANAYGIEISAGAALDADGVKVVTGSDHAPALAIEDSDSRATLTGGSYASNGPLAPAIFVGGTLMATHITASAREADAIVVDGAHTLTLTAADLSADRAGVLLYGADKDPALAPGAVKASTAADYLPNSESHPPAIVSMQDGTLKSRGEAFSVSNLLANITLTHVDIQAGDGVIVKAVAAQSGAMGRNGGEAHIETHHQILNGDFVTDVISDIRLDLREGSQFSGKTTTNVDVILDASSTWTLTGDTKVGKLLGAAISGDQVSNIAGNGHQLSYDPRYNPGLAGKTYQLSGGGTLVPGDGL